MPNFSGPEGELSELYLSETDILERYVGNQLWLWGSRENGQLGDNASFGGISSPIQTISAGTNWKQVSCGQSLTSVIKVDGSLWSWGRNTNGQLGDNTSIDKSSPVQTISAGTNWKQVSSGSANISAIKTDGTLWSWGLNLYGNLGDNSIDIQKSSPVQTVSAGTNWKQVSCGDIHTAAIKTDGTLWLWGSNIWGNLGDNTIIHRSSPVQTISGGTNWKQVSCGSNTTAAIKTDGTLWVWGMNTYGQLGTNDIVHRSSPVQTISGGTNWKQVSCGGNTSRNQIAAIKTDGTLWLWGYNAYGQLGDNTIIDKSSPVQTVSGGTNWKQVSTGGNGITAAIKTDGTLWAWGLNNSGQIGDNTQIYKSSPVQTIAGGTNWKQVSCGMSGYTAAVTYTES